MKFKNKEEFWQFVSMCEPGDCIHTSVESLKEVIDITHTEYVPIKIGETITFYGVENDGQLTIKAINNRHIDRPILNES